MDKLNFPYKPSLLLKDSTHQGILDNTPRNKWTGTEHVFIPHLSVISPTSIVF